MPRNREEETTSNWMKEAQKGYIRVAVLIIINKKPSHGYEIMKEIREKTKGFWSPTAGGVYPILRNLEESGYIKGEWETEKNRRLKTYKITDSGRQILERAIEKQNEIAGNMTALFKDFARDVLNIETNAHPTMPTFFEAFLEEKKGEAESLEEEREKIVELIKMLRERLDMMEGRLKAVDRKILKTQPPKKK
jgi:PadR family transcriptional regulator, regulatory protein PadR